MYYTVDLYLERINYTMENVIAPAIEDDFARGQVFAVLTLLEGLGKEIEHKNAFIHEETKSSAGLLDLLIPSLRKVGTKTPDELVAFHEQLDRDGSGSDISCRNKLDEMLSLAIDLFFQNKNSMDKAETKKLDVAIRESITEIVTRNFGLMAFQNIEKISGKRED